MTGSTNLAILFVVVIVVTMVLFILAMYRGGGSAAIRRQGGTLIGLALVLTLIGTGIYLVAETRGGLASLVPVVSVGAALAAGIQARDISVRESTSRIPARAFVLWLLAGVFTVIALVGVVMLLS